MVCELESDIMEDMDIEDLPSMWPEDVVFNVGKQFNVERPRGDQDMLEEVTIIEEPTIVDFKRLLELTNYTEKGSSQLQYLAKQWEYKQANAVRLLKEELDIMNKQRQEFELKELKIVEEHLFEDERYGDYKRPISILEEVYDLWQDVPQIKNDFVFQNKRVEIEPEYDTITYWKQKAAKLEKLLEASLQREHILTEKLQESIKNIEKQTSPVEELSQILKRADNFLHFVLQNAPVVIGHQDNELRYRFIYNHFPSLDEEDIIGKTDVEIFHGAGVKESQDFKREVLEKRIPAKREITFDTPLFGLKTFLIYVEPVFSKAGETIGINYMGMDVTDQVRKREKMAKLREEIAVQKAKETELNKTIHITEETMRAKQMLATMSHEIRSPLSGVVSMAEILATTKLDREQRQLLDVMLSSGDLVIQLINDILDLSKVESGVMKLEATKFRPREVVKHVLQTAAASLQKCLLLEGHVADDVPVEVIGDVLRIRQILTNLISNAIKFTHQGKVGIKIYVVPDQLSWKGEECHQRFNAQHSTVLSTELEEEKCPSVPQNSSDRKNYFQNQGDSPQQNHSFCPDIRSTGICEPLVNGKREEPHEAPETTVWIRCDVYDTGIGIPVYSYETENALPTLFKKYMQVSADHARKYGGTGLGLAICKQLVELIGGRLTVSSQEHRGSTFTFVLPYKLSTAADATDDSDEIADVTNYDVANSDSSEGFFQFQPGSFGSLTSSNGCSRTQKLSHNNGYATSKENGLGWSSNSFLSNARSKEMPFLEDACSVADSTTLEESKTTQNHNENSVCGVSHCQDKTNGQSLNDSNDSPHSMGKERQEFISKGAFEPQVNSKWKEKSDSRFHGVNNVNSEVSQSASKPRILLVEDNKTNIMVTQSMMKKLGHSIDVVTNGADAVRAVQCFHYDLVLMDVCMPIMDGLQATRLIRSFEEIGNWDAAEKAGIEPVHGRTVSSSKRIPIVAMTANALAESAGECFANGMDSFVSKPVTFPHLKQCLEKYLT